MISEEQRKTAYEMLEKSNDPLFFYHDDPDGLCAFLILYRHFKKGHGICVKASPYLSPEFLPKVSEHKADLIVVLDIAHIEDEFIEQAKLPILWIDHHEPNQKKGTTYLNPRLSGENWPVSWLAHKITDDDLWLGFAGCVSDWIVPQTKEFNEKYPNYIEEPFEPPHLLFKTKLGTLVKSLSFNLKGSHSDVKKSINCLTKIIHPDEIIYQSSPPGKFLWKKYEKINREYEETLNEATTQTIEDNFLVYIYSEYRTSLTKDLANEVYANHPDKIIVLGREKSDKVMFSIRGQKNIAVALEKALQGLEAKGGGHEHACGGWINAQEFPEMVSRLKQELS